MVLKAWRMVRAQGGFRPPWYLNFEHQNEMGLGVVPRVAIRGGLTGKVSVRWWVVAQGSRHSQ